jgi:RHS repeat-associated protein
MRDAQARYFAAKGEYYSWPACPCTGQAAPLFPADGFYGKEAEDPAILASLASAIQGCLQLCFGAYIKPDEVSSINGASQIPDWMWGQWSEICSGDACGTITAENASSALGGLRGVVRKLIVLPKGVGARYQSKAAGGPPVQISTGDTSCTYCWLEQDDVFTKWGDAAKDGIAIECPGEVPPGCGIWAGSGSWNSSSWTPFVNGAAQEIRYVQNGAFEKDGLSGKWRAISANSGGTGGIAYFASKGVLTCDLTGQEGNGNLYIMVSWGDKKGEACPVEQKNSYTSFESVTGGSSWQSQLIGNYQGTPLVSASDISGNYVNVTYDWGITGAVVVFYPKFKTDPMGASGCGTQSDCDGCGSDKDASGGVDSVNWRMPFGTDRYGKSSGTLRMYSTSLLHDYAGTPWSLFVEGPAFSGAAPALYGVSPVEIRNVGPGNGQDGLPGRFFQRQFISQNRLVNVEDFRWNSNPFAGSGVSEFGYDLAVYDEASINAANQVNGLFVPQGAPAEVYAVRIYKGDVVHPVSGQNAIGARLRILRTHGGSNRFWEWIQVGETWRYSEGLGAAFTDVLKQEILEVVADGQGGRTETRTLKNAPSDWTSLGQIAGKVRSVFTALNGPQGPVVLTARIIDPDGAALTTSYVYDTLTSSTTHGRLVGVLHSSGHWNEFAYDAQQRLSAVRESYLGSGPSSGVSSEIQYEHYFLNVDGNSATDAIIAKTEVVAGSVVGRTLDVYWGRSVIPNVPNTQHHTRIELADASIDQPAEYASAALTAVQSMATSPHRVTHRQRVDGPESNASTNVDLSYSSSGSLSATYREAVGSSSTSSWKTTTIAGRLAFPVNPLSVGVTGSAVSSLFEPGYVKSVTQRDARGNVVLSQSFQDAGGAEHLLASRSARQFEASGLKRRVTKYESTAGPAQHEDIEYNCCHVSARIDADGVRTEYDYDGLGRVIAQRREIDDGQFVSTHYTYDARNRVRSVTQRDTSGSATTQIVRRLTAFDVAGRVTGVTSAESGLTTQTEVVQGGRIVRTAILQDPDASGPEASPVVVQKFYPDGRMESTEGSGTFPVRYEYSIAADTDPLSNLGGFSAKVTKTIRVGENLATTEWTADYQNQFGDTYKQVAADGATTRRIYDVAGRMTRSIDADGVTTLYRERGDGDASVSAAVQFALDSSEAEWSLTAVDMDQDGQVDFSNGATGPAGTLADQIKLTQRYVESDQSGVWRARSTKVWSDPSNPTQNATVSVSRDRADGMLRESLNHGRKTVTSVVRNRATASIRIDTFAPDGTSAGMLTTYGLERSVATFTTVPNSAPLTQVAYFYDDFGRREQITDTRGTTTTADDRISFVTFNSAGLPVTSTTPAPAVGEPTQTTSTVYDALGRVIRVDLPDGVSQHTAYFPNGKVKKTYGARMYPSEYTYDMQGRMKTLKTWKDFNEAAGTGTTGAAVTTWTYSPTRGYLTSKTYEGGQAGPTYAYAASGRLLSRTWARGVVTTYGYNNAGQLASVNYSDVTPDVTMKFDRRGRTIEVSDAVGARTLAYATDGSLLTEDFGAGWLDEISQHSGYDTFGRRTSLELRRNAIAQSSLAYGYDAQSGRYAFVTKGGLRADYGYETGGELVSSLTLRNGTAVNSPVMLTTSYNVDAIGRMRSIAHDSVLGPDEAYAYTYDAANQRTRLDLIDGSSWVYQYDAMGQVIGGKRYKDGGANPTNPVPGQQYEYGFDDIGNRTLAKMGGNTAGGGLRTTTYTANALNQYTERNNNRSSDIMGYAPANSNVTVKGSPADYRWNRFYQELISRTSGGSVLDLVEIDWNAQAGPEDMRAVIVPPTLEKYFYDADGNMTQDARWNYVWDGENRLIRMETRPNLDASIPKRKLEFGYDYASRRVRMDSYGWLDIELNPNPGEGGVIVEDEGAGGAGGGGTGGEPDPNAGPSGFWEIDGTAFYLWDGWNMVAHLGGYLDFYQSYAWGLDVSQSEQGAGGVGGLLFLTEHNTNATRYTTYDGNGNVTSYRATDGEVRGSYEYGPFGESVASDGAYRSVYPFRFSTKYQDAESGLLYYGYRYYHAGMGRWLSRDPIGEIGGLSVYGLLGNSTLSGVDYLGLQPTDIDGPNPNWDSDHYVRVKRLIRVKGPAVTKRQRERILHAVQVARDRLDVLQLDLAGALNDPCLSDCVREKLQRKYSTLQARIDDMIETIEKGVPTIHIGEQYEDMYVAYVPPVRWQLVPTLGQGAITNGNDVYLNYVGRDDWELLTDHQLAALLAHEIAHTEEWPWETNTDELLDAPHNPHYFNRIDGYFDQTISQTAMFQVDLLFAKRDCKATVKQ